MSSRGRGLLQSDDDYKIAEELGVMFGCDVLGFAESKRAEIVQKMENDSLLSRKLEKILSPEFVPPTSHQSRPRMAVILVVLAMRLGARVEAEYMSLMHTLAPHLRNMFEQLQLVTALDEYKNNGTPWILGSKSREETEKSDGLARPASIVGHAEPIRMSYVAVPDVTWPGSYCSKDCQKHDWAIHRTFCEQLEPRSVDVPDLGATILEEHLS
ncbi:hypothetical protein PG994_010545 [Apiospora phragmitis]|uniref:ZMYND11/ZMYD8 MYND zinc finger domain-containing protein n=1 Tax=Apiospora phragmitis TaxID=2905665 RepID=A0ABR1TSI1_9PEZI